MQLLFYKPNTTTDSGLTSRKGRFGYHCIILNDFSNFYTFLVQRFLFDIVKSVKEEEVTSPAVDTVFPLLPDVKCAATKAIGRAARNGNFSFLFS